MSEIEAAGHKQSSSETKERRATSKTYTCTLYGRGAGPQPCDEASILPLLCLKGETVFADPDGAGGLDEQNPIFDR